MDTMKLRLRFEQQFGNADGCSVWMAPGRINLIGEHTDYNGGFVFPGAVCQSITALIRTCSEPRVRLWAEDLGMGCEFDLDDAEGPDTVPLAAGMSSSAALECCFANALNELFGGGLDKMALALVGQSTEHKYVGVKCGIMDQFVSMYGKAGSLVRLDCRSGEFVYYPWHPEGYRLVLVNSCVKHELVGSPYNDRRNSCERVAAAVGVETLRDCSWEMLEGVRKEISDEDYRRAKFVLGECDRVLAVSSALERGDYETVGKQMYLTHEGLSKDYEVSCEEIDFLVEEAVRCGVTGARIMGGGFGGCTINLVREEVYDRFVKEVQERYKERFGRECKVIPVVIGDGARRIVKVVRFLKNDLL